MNWKLFRKERSVANFTLDEIVIHYDLWLNMWVLSSRNEDFFFLAICLIICRLVIFPWSLTLIAFIHKLLLKIVLFLRIMTSESINLFLHPIFIISQSLHQSNLLLWNHAMVLEEEFFRLQACLFLQYSSRKCILKCDRELFQSLVLRH